jgi:hypothetical protein
MYTKKLSLMGCQLDGRRLLKLREALTTSDTLEVLDETIISPTTGPPVFDLLPQMKESPVIGLVKYE